MTMIIIWSRLAVDYIKEMNRSPCKLFVTRIDTGIHNANTGFTPKLVLAAAAPKSLAAPDN